MGNSDQQTSLRESLQQQEFEFSRKTVKQLAKFCELLWEANQHVNLTRHLDYATFVARDLVDVMRLSQLIDENQEVLDIGSGGGVPGLVLAIVRPDLQISVCESVGKKAKLLKSFVDTLELPVAVFHDRAENVLDDMSFDCCMARAVGPMWKLLTWLNGRWLSARRLLALKGPRWAEEVSEAKTRGLTKGLVIQPVARYPLQSTDPQAEQIDSFIIQVAPAK
ncbi:MAG: 16S rRNA (guanine(527)-N(7))-methyltransferase RsmG [Pirellulaceae bacterium]